MNSKRIQISTTLPYLAVIPLIILGILSILATGGGAVVVALFFYRTVGASPISIRIALPMALSASAIARLLRLPGALANQYRVTLPSNGGGIR